MNILQMEDLVKGMPDEMLMQEAQMPSGQIPQFLALSEVQRRKEMRDKFQAPPQATVADQILQSGIASAMPQQPPQGGMAPPQGPPMGAPQGPVMAYGGGMMPYTMADGGAVPGGPLAGSAQADVIRESQSGKARFADFLRQNLTTPQGLGRLAAGALGTAVGGPLAGYAASAGFNRLFPMGPSALESAVQNVQQANNPFGMYGQSFAQAGADRQAALDQAGAMALGNRYQDYLNRMTNPFAGTGSGIVRDERLGDQSLNLDDYGMGMYGGGQVPYRMQEGRTVPGTNPAISDLNARIASAIMPRRAQFTVIREAKALRDQGKIDEAVNLLTQEGIDPRQVLGDMPAAPAPAAAPAAPAPAAAPPAGPTDMLAFPMRPIGLTPDFSAMAAPSSAPGVTPPAGGAMPAAPRQDAASMISEIAGALPDATRALSGMNAGIPDATRLLRGAEPVQADYEALRPDFSPFIQQVEQRGKESVQRYEQSIKDIEDRMKKERLGAVLTTLGANLMAGESALGLEKAGALAQQMGKEARQEIAAERRALDAAREGTADKVLTLQLQQVTADTGAKRDFLKANDEFRKLGVQVAIDQGKEARAAQRDMNQLALNLASNTISRLKSLDEQNALNTRSFVTAMSAESDTILKLLEQMVITDPNEKIKKYNQLMESKIRGYGALYPNIDISSVISAFKQDTGGTGGTGAQSGSSRFDVQVVNPGR